MLNENKYFLDLHFFYCTLHALYSIYKKEARLTEGGDASFKSCK